jgi:hypothetical protein
MSRSYQLTPLLTVALAASLCVTTTPASASTDSKIVSGTVCQPDRPADAEFLRYLARGLFADIPDSPKNHGVTEIAVTCPLLRDSTLSSLARVEVRFARGIQQPPQGQPHSLFVGPFTGKLLSCSETQINNPCNESEHSSPKDFNAEVTRAVPLIFEGSTLPKANDGTYSFKTTLPKGTLLRSIRYKEKVD